MPVSVGAIISGIVEAVGTAAEAVGGAVVGGLEAAGGALAGGAEAAGLGGAAAAETGGVIGGGVEAITAAGGALPEIGVTAAAPLAAETLGGTEAALGGAAALGGGAEAALAGGGALTAAELGGGLAGGALGGAELASLLGGGTTAGLTGGALPGAAPVPTTGVSNIAQNLGTPAPVGPTTGGVALGSPTAGGLPADVLSGQTGPLSALQPQTTPFEQLWQQSGAAELPPSTDISAVQPGGGGALSLAETTNATAPINPLASVSPSVDQAFAGAPAATPGQIPLSTAEGLLEPATETNLAGTGTLTPTGAPIAPETATPGATPLTSFEGAVASPANPNVGGVFGSPATAAGGGVSGGLGGLLSGSNLRTAAMLAPLGALGLTLARGQPSLPPAEQAAVANVGPGSPVAQVAQTQLQEGATGQLTPGQAAQVNKYVSDAKNQLYQLYARMGRDPTNDTDYIQGLATIDQNAQIMTQQFVTAAITNGLAAQGVIDQTLQSAAQLQVQNDQAFQASIASATQAFGLTAALSAATMKG